MKPKSDLSDVLLAIKNKEVFQTTLSDHSLYIKIAEYVPYVCFAIHNGHQLRSDLDKKCLLNKQEQLYEEDPYTFNFISSMPIVISANDSRYEYDLNRPPEDAIYQISWGKKVWDPPLSSMEKNKSLAKHATFYKIVFTLLKRLEDIFTSVLIFDFHSYNYKRIPHETPVFNLGTKLINKSKFQSIISYWLRELSKIKLPNLDVKVRENEVFCGQGYLLSYISNHFKNSLVLATEIKKIFCNEKTGEPYPLMIDALTSRLKKAIVDTAGYYANKFSGLSLQKKSGLLSSKIDESLLKIDKKLYSIVRNFEILYYINPNNLEQSKKEFIKSKFTKEPEFKYTQIIINPFEFKRKLYSLPVESIQDISLRILYQDVIDSYADKVDILSSIGTEKFLYNSLRYFGEPKVSDIQNAHYLLHCSSKIDAEYPSDMNAHQVHDYFYKIMKDYGFQCKIEISKNIVSKVLILNSKKSIKIRKDALFSQHWLHALSEHEIGVHMLTTINSSLQPLNVFRLGTPLNTHTQEGLAVLVEYLSGNLSIHRLQILAFRVLALEKLLKGNNFKQTFHFLMDTKIPDVDQAFYLTARVFRGGGLTKDYLYLKGFQDLLKFYKSKQNLMPLLVGKTTLKYYNIINEMIERKILLEPKYQTFSILNPAQPDPIVDYILEGLI